MKRFLVVLSTIILTAGMISTPVFASKVPEKHLVIDGEYKATYRDNRVGYGYGGYLPYTYTIQGRTYLPLRDVVQFLGGEIHFEGATKTVSIKGINVKTRKPVSFVGKLHSNKMTVDGVTRQLDTNPEVKIEVIGDNTCVPLRTISEIFGYGVNFESLTQCILLENPNAEKEPSRHAPEPNIKNVPVDSQQSYIQRNVLNGREYKGEYKGKVGMKAIPGIDFRKSALPNTPFGDYYIKIPLQHINESYVPYASFNGINLKEAEEVLSYFTKDYKEIIEALKIALVNKEIGDTETYKYGIKRTTGYNTNGSAETIQVPTRKITTSDGVEISFEKGRGHIDDHALIHIK